MTWGIAPRRPLREQWMRVRRSLEEKVGVEEASYLMDRPMGGWSELVTNHTLDLKFAVVDERFRSIDERFRAIDERFHSLEARLDVRFDALEEKLEDKIETSIAALRHEFVAELEQRFESLAWKLVTAVIAAMGVMGALFGVLVVLFA